MKRDTVISLRVDDFLLGELRDEVDRTASRSISGTCYDIIRDYFLSQRLLCQHFGGTPFRYLEQIERQTQLALVDDGRVDDREAARIAEPHARLGHWLHVERLRSKFGPKKAEKREQVGRAVK